MAQYAFRGNKALEIGRRKNRLVFSAEIFDEPNTAKSHAQSDHVMRERCQTAARSIVERLRSNLQGMEASARAMLQLWTLVD